MAPAGGVSEIVREDSSLSLALATGIGGGAVQADARQKSGTSTPTRPVRMTRHSRCKLSCANGWRGRPGSRRTAPQPPTFTHLNPRWLLAVLVSPFPRVPTRYRVQY